jgi:hypothetical protein
VLGGAEVRERPGASAGGEANHKPVPGEKKFDFLDQPASGALGRNAIAIAKSDRFQVIFLRLERAYRARDGLLAEVCCQVAVQSGPSPVVCTRALEFVNLVYSSETFSIFGAFDRILTESGFWATNFGTLQVEGVRPCCRAHLSPALLCARRAGWKGNKGRPGET